MSNLNINIALPEATAHVQKEVSEILATLAPIMAQRVVEARRRSSERLLDTLLEGVVPRAPDMKLVRMEANAIKAILQHSV